MIVTFKILFHINAFHSLLVFQISHSFHMIYLFGAGRFVGCVQPTGVYFFLTELSSLLQSSLLCVFELEIFFWKS